MATKFYPKTSHTAKVTVSNPKSVGFDYTATMAIGGEIHRLAFYLNGSESKDLYFDIAMPQNTGTYLLEFTIVSMGVTVHQSSYIIEIALSAIGNLSGAVCDYDTPYPYQKIPGVRIVAAPCSEIQDVIKETYSDASGNYRLTGLKTSDWTIYTYKDGYQSFQHRANIKIGENTRDIVTKRRNSAPRTVATIVILPPTPGGSVNPPPGTYYLNDGQYMEVEAIPSSGFRWAWWTITGYGGGGAYYPEYGHLRKIRIGAGGIEPYYPGNRIEEWKAGFESTAQAPTPYNPPAQGLTPPPAQLETYKILNFDSVYVLEWPSSIVDHGFCWQQRYSTGRLPVRAIAGSHVTLSVDFGYYLQGQIVGLRQRRIKWFIKEPNGVVTELRTGVSGSYYEQAGFNAVVTGNYSATVVLLGSINGITWYELDRATLPG